MKKETQSKLLMSGLALSAIVLVAVGSRKSPADKKAEIKKVVADTHGEEEAKKLDEMSDQEAEDMHEEIFPEAGGGGGGGGGGSSSSSSSSSTVTPRTPIILKKYAVVRKPPVTTVKPSLTTSTQLVKPILTKTVTRPVSKPRSLSFVNGMVVYG